MSDEFDLDGEGFDDTTGNIIDQIIVAEEGENQGDDPGGGVIDPTRFLSCDELFYPNTGKDFSAELEREYTRRFRVVMDIKNIPPSIFIGAEAVIQAPGIPTPFSPYTRGGGLEQDITCLLVERTADRENEDDSQSWIVTCTYSTRMPPYGPSPVTNEAWNPTGAQNLPWLMPPEIEFDYETENEAPNTDRNGVPYMNSALQPFTPAPTFPTVYPIVSITINMQNFDTNLQVIYGWAVNSAPFLDNPPGTVQCYPPRGKVQYLGAIAYTRVQWRFRIKTKMIPDPNNPGQSVRDTWQPMILDAGMFEMLTVPIIGIRIPVPIFRHGVPVSQPVLLNGSGSPLQPVGGVYTPVYIQYTEFNEIDFNDLFNDLPIPPL